MDYLVRINPPSSPPISQPESAYENLTLGGTFIFIVNGKESAVQITQKSKYFSLINSFNYSHTIMRLRI